MGRCVHAHSEPGRRKHGGDEGHCGALPWRDAEMAARIQAAGLPGMAERRQEERED